MEDVIRVATPDNVELAFDLAGAGSRFLALIIDTLVWLGIMVVLIVVFIVTSGISPSGSLPYLEAWQTAVFIFVFFLARWGYFIAFESLLRGQTPGKRAIGLRVIRENGLPPSVYQILIRNLLRIADMLPPPTYLLGGLTVLFSRKGQRLGDLAAGTLVIRERYGSRGRLQESLDYGAGWVTRLERGQSQFAVVLPKGSITIRQVALIDAYHKRKDSLTVEQRNRLAWQIIQPLLPLFDIQPAEVEDDPQRLRTCESLMDDVLSRVRRNIAREAEPSRIDEDVQSKSRTWSSFTSTVDRLLRSGKIGLKNLGASELKSLLIDYRRISTDLARAQSMGADRNTLSKLNRMAIGGHNLLYGYVKSRMPVSGRRWFGVFAREVRENLRIVAMSAIFFFAAALVSFLAVRWQPELAFELVGPEFYDFEPAREESLHDIPQIIRPVAASAILSNNLQVSILAFAFGMTLGIGTAYLLIFNGMHLGSVIGWMSLSGNGRALWGWVMPHGVTEITAIIIAGAAGLLLAKGILIPGAYKRSRSLLMMAKKALILEVGCMLMLGVAGLIEGFVSPSGIGFSARMAIMAGSLALWLLYFSRAGRSNQAAGAGDDSPTAGTRV
jgi:uncharacterized membrane protein SpoIIM required for sporulation/uncharacterized RDD family membrane protein YckC